MKKVTKLVIISSLMLSSFVQAPLSVADASTRITTSKYSRKKVNHAKKNQIAKRNYKSLNGTWRNSHGYKLVFKNGRVSAPLGKNNSQKKFKLNKPVTADHVIFIDLTPFLRPNGMSLMLALKGTKVKTNGPDATNHKKDRIIMANNGGTALFASKHNGGIPDTAYYKK